MNLADIRTNIKLMLSINNSELSEAEIDRAMNQAVSALSRFFPRERVATVVYDEDVSGESFTSNHGTAVSLANKPLKFGSETVTDDPAVTTYVKDTDYEMDYFNGTITALSTGSMSNSAAHLITYVMDMTVLDISSVLTEPISIRQVDVLDREEIPRTLEGWEWYGDFLTILTDGASSQSRFRDNDHIRIYYYAQHVEPLVSTEPSYPRFLDELVLIGISGYALLIEVTQQEHQAFADLASARATIANLATVHIAIDTRVASIVTVHAAVVTALDTVKTDIKAASKSILSEIDSAIAELVLANIELDKHSAHIDTAKTELDTANTELDKYSAHVDNANTETLLINPEVDKVIVAGTGPIAEANTQIDLSAAILGQSETALDKVTTHLTGASDSSKAILDTVEQELDKITIALDQVATELLSSTRNADEYLNIGDALINTIPVGADPAGHNRRFAEVKVTIGRTFIEEATAHASDGSIRIQEAIQRTAIATGFITEALGRVRESEARINEAVNGYLAIADRHLTTADGYAKSSIAFIRQAEQRLNAGGAYTANSLGYIRVAEQRVTVANGFISNAQGYIAAADGRWKQIQGFVAEAQGRIAEISTYVDEITQRNVQMAQYIAEANAYYTSSASVRESAELMRLEANSRLSSFFQALEDRSQISTQVALSAPRQYADYNQRTVRGYGRSYTT